MIRLLISTLGTFFMLVGVNAQLHPFYDMQNGTIQSTTCGVLFRDNGGGSDYTNSFSGTITFIPGIVNNKISINFLSFNTESGWDKMTIYDGPDDTYPILIADYSGSVIPVGNPFISTAIGGEITIKFTSDGSVSRSGWEAEVTCQSPPSCPDPITISAPSILWDQAEISWLENGSASLWDIEYVGSGNPPTGVPSVSGVNANPYILTGLTPDTEYDLYVRSDCGGGDRSTWSGPYTFSTTIRTGLVYVASSSGVMNGVYSNMGEAFSKINDGTHQGDIVITVGDGPGQTILEPVEAKLNKSGVGAVQYGSVLIHPGGTNITIKGEITNNSSGNCCYPGGVLSLFEANNVTIDGRQSGQGSTIDLSIENTSVHSKASAMTFINASNNILEYVTLKSSNSGTSGGYGTLSFKDNNASGGDPGCDNNRVENCHFTLSGTDMPNVAIASDGVPGTEEHNDNILINNTITNFKRYGIWLGGGSSDGGNRDWIIEENQIYQMASVTFSSANMAGICVGTPFSSSGSEAGTFRIANNRIGGNGSGGNWEAVTTIGSRYLAGVFVNTTVLTSETNITGNQISDFHVTVNESNYSSANPSFSGILVTNGLVTVERNLIGSMQTPTIFLENTTSGGFACGIHVKTPTDAGIIIQGNRIGGVSLTSGSGKFGTFYGIRNENNSSGDFITSEISYNKVAYLISSKCNYLTGIYAEGNIFNNSVLDIDFVGAASFSELKGIHSFGGRRVENNEVILGVNKSGTVIAVNDDLTGIQRSQYPGDFHHNSVLIQGQTNGGESTYSFKMDNLGVGSTFENNLLYNARLGGSGNHFSVYTSETNTADIVMNNNAYLTEEGGNNYTGYWTGNRISLTDWSVITGELDAIGETSFIKPAATLFPYLSMDSLIVTDNWLVAGTYTLSADIDNVGRATPPTIGAYEISSPLPIELLYFSGFKKEERVNTLEWVTLTESQNERFDVERSRDGVVWDKIGEVSGAGTSWEERYYTLNDDSPEQQNYYRLKQIDYDGKFTYSTILLIQNSADKSKFSEGYPNPVSDYHFIRLMLDVAHLKVTLYDGAGAKVWDTKFFNKEAGQVLSIDMSELESGTYHLSLEGENLIEKRKVIVVKN